MIVFDFSSPPSSKSRGSVGEIGPNVIVEQLNIVPRGLENLLFPTQVPDARNGEEPSDESDVFFSFSMRNTVKKNYKKYTKHN